MNWFNSGLFFVRRLSVIYLFVLLTGIIFGFYYLKYLPANEQELKARGLRILNQLSVSIIAKNDELKTFFAHVKVDNDFINHIGYFSRINQQLPYIVDSNFQSEGSGNEDFKPYIESDGDQGWNFIYSPKNISNYRYRVSVDISDYMLPIVKSRDDLFDSYLLLKAKDKDSDNRRSPVLPIVYLENIVTAGTTINADTLFKMQKNSDGSQVTDINISGTHYKTFFRPLRLNNQNLILTGLLKADKYNTSIKTVPANFISTILMVIIFVFICLPFIKLFLLSSKESIGKLDVIGCTVSIFVGSSAIFLICFYMFLQFVTQQTFEQRLKNIGEKIRGDIENEIDSASVQLDDFNRIYKNELAGKTAGDALYPWDYKMKMAENKDSALFTTNLLSPTHYKNVSGVFWMDSSGNTIAKCNFLENEIPIDNLSDNPFFTVVKNLDPRLNSSTKTPPIVYASRISATGEFQTFIGKPARVKIFYSHLNESKVQGTKDTLLSMITCMPVFLNCSVDPILPPGFGFCVTDSLSNVLIHSDGKRNLREKLFDEANYNQRLMNCFYLENNAAIEDVTVYGKPQTLQVFSIKKQPLKLIVFFDQTLLIPNQVRLLHFVIEVLLYLCLIQFLCILVPSWITRSNKKLRFIIEPIEWIRPDFRNKYSYFFTYHYYIRLLTFTGAFFIFVLLANLDLRILFYISLVIPFFALWAFVASRQQEMNYRNLSQSLVQDDIKSTTFHKNRFIPKVEIDFLGPTTIIILILINFVIFHLIQISQNSLINLDASLVLFFELVLIWYLRSSYIRFKNELQKEYPTTTDELINKDAGDEKKEDKEEQDKKVLQLYGSSLFMAVLIISLLPAIGIISYGFQSEKIQFKKMKELAIASEFIAREQHLNNELIPAYKKNIFEELKRTGYFEELVKRKSIYLSDGDSLWIASAAKYKVPHSRPLIDEPYSSLMDDWFLITAQDFENYSIKAAAMDTAWQFTTGRLPDKGNGLLLSYSGTPSDSLLNSLNVFVWNNIRNPIRNFSGLKIFLILFSIGIPLLLIFIFYKVIRESIQRLFLLKFLSRGEKMKIDKDFLESIFSNAERGKQIYEINLADHTDPWGLIMLERKADNPYGVSQDEFVLANTIYFNEVHKKIWKILPDEEKYLLYDLSLDGYTNYKNPEIIFRLLNKGLICYNHYKLEFFSFSFRQFLISKKNTEEINNLERKLSVSGSWDSFRIPVLSIIAVGAIFLVVTQNDVSHQLTAVITSVGALLPLILKIFQSGNTTNSS